MSDNVIHTWEPSECLKRLIARQASMPQPDDEVSAHQWICDNAARFSTKHLATAVKHLVYRHFGRKTTLAELRRKVARSRIENHVVKGDLQGMQGIGARTVEELRRVLGVSE